MRRHPAIAASLAITLALGGTALVSFAAAADPPPAGWTASVSPPVYTNDLYFSGTKPEGETADSVVVSTAAGDEEIASWACTGFDDLYATVWDCYYDGAMPVGDGTIYFGGAQTDR